MVGLPGTASAQGSPDWTEPFPPFHIAGNLYYVGSKGLANYLVTTPEGHILINSDLETNVPLIQASIEKLGFKFSDVKVLLISHAHWDHNAASALIKQRTGAKYMVMDADVSVVESGGKTDFQYGGSPSTLYPATKVDRVLHDGDQVKLGNAVLTARLTPGHTRGCTTWTMKVTENGALIGRGYRRQPECEPLVQAGEQPVVSYNRRRLRPHVPCLAFASMRLLSRRPRCGDFDMEAEVRAVHRWRTRRVYRSGGLQEVCRPERAGVSHRAGETAIHQ